MKIEYLFLLEHNMCGAFLYQYDDNSTRLEQACFSIITDSNAHVQRFMLPKYRNLHLELSFLEILNN